MNRATFVDLLTVIICNQNSVNKVVFIKYQLLSLKPTDRKFLKTHGLLILFLFVLCAGAVHVHP